MKAKVKSTGVELEVHLVDKQARYIGNDGVTYWEEDLDFGVKDKDNIDYWTRLEHQYAGMAMQGILANIDLLMSLTKKKDPDYPAKYTVAEFAKDCAHALVEKMKNKEE